MVLLNSDVSEHTQTTQPSTVLKRFRRKGSLDALTFQCVDKERHADLHKLSSTDNMNETKGHKY
jgi:hypothetical protein